MITGFERETHKLTDYECEMIRPMINGLLQHIGKDNAVTSTQMIAGMKTHGFKINPPRVRKLINFIRVTNRLKNVIATSHGYYISTKQTEIDNYKKSLDERISAIQALRNSFNN